MASLVENTDDAFTNQPKGGAEKANSRQAQLVEYCMTRVNSGRDARDSAWSEVWGEWYRLWRGRHIDSDKNYASERSKLVAPALAQALEMTVSELEEAAFGRQQWVDILDPEGNPDHSASVIPIRRQFIQDMEQDGVPGAICESMLNGGLFGTLGGKISVEPKVKKQIVDVPNDPDDPSKGVTRQVKELPGVSVKLVPVSVFELVPDQDGTTTEEMHFVAHEVNKTPSWVSQFDWGKEYAKRGKAGRESDYDWRPELKDPEDTAVVQKNVILITEYHGFVPRKLLSDTAFGPGSKVVDPLDPLASALIQSATTKDFRYDGDPDELVESIVTIADKRKLLRAMENPFYMKDRSIFGCAFEKVPGRFWGRGVMEKGQNPQRALDAELRARMDAMALISNPMLAADSTALPRGFDLRVRPGKVWLVQGKKPQDALMPFQFPGLDPASFSQTSEMERMVQMGTGAMDTATPLAENRRNETLGGTSMIAGAFVKRCKRSLRHITANFIDVAVRKILWRRMQYDQGRYPAELEFQIVSTLGIIAREVEQSNLLQAMTVLDKGSTPQLVATKAFFDNSSSPYKAEMVKAITDSMVPTEEQQAARQMEMTAQKLNLELLFNQSAKLKAEALLSMAKVQTELAKPGVDMEQLRLEYARLSKDFEEISAYSMQSKASMITALTKAAHGGAKVIQDGQKLKSDAAKAK